MAKRPKYREQDFPVPGTVFIAPTADGRLSSGRVLRREFHGGAQGALIAASSWIGDTLPRLDLPELGATLILSHHKWKEHPEVFWVHDVMPPSFRIIGQIELSLDDIAATSNAFTGWQSVPLQALLQWRWDHDREALQREEQLQATAIAEARQRTAEARAEFERTLTLDSLVGRTWLPTWDAEGSSLPLHDSRALISSLVDQLRHAPKLTKGLAKRLLKQSVEAFNQLDTMHQFITTIEREDLCDAYEQIMSAARFPQLADSVDEWREW